MANAFFLVYIYFFTTLIIQPKFLRKEKKIAKILKISRTKLVEDELFYKKGGSGRVQAIFLGLLFLIVGIVGLIIAPLTEILPVMGLGLFLVLIAISRFIKAAFVPVLTPEGKGVRKDIEKMLDYKKGKFESILEEEPADALSLFFKDLPYLILHKKFDSNSFRKYKKKFKKVDEFEKPEWLEFDLSKIDKTLDALDVVEVIDYVLLSTLFIVIASSGVAGAGGTGGSGGAGGGGAS